ncbi:MAG: glycosyltransferase [Phenylobacterium sp.]|uniref:glycosyltransferase family 4 protein n=1 Tax=Phenylobacterium sp. TaxID=1871053 RepID=UPI0025DEC035|nr:glycosyltransferase family 4 protein [Phenylobacterium sp.]MBI1198509.1 glycosyltransferase [Phenylobacterium sp.]
MAATPPAKAVIRFEPDGYDVSRSWLMGRQVAGHGFLRAAVDARGDAAMHCYTAHESSAKAFADTVHGIDPKAVCGWIRPTRLGAIGAAGGILYLADPSLPNFARPRLRAGPAAYSLCGVTHTTATPGTMQLIADLLTSPVAPWDALICTSQAVAETVRRIHEAHADYLRWRLGDGVRIAGPQLPVIPLGVHCRDFDFTDDQRHAARAALGVAPDEVVALFVGRFTFSGKHHPAAMYLGLEDAARETGARVVLVQCGWAPNEAIDEVFQHSPGHFCPSVRTITVDGRLAPERNHAWAAADIFVSLSDGIQETFGLTPLEAMACGLPTVVSDWDGYKDTVRDGVDGFRISTWAPAAGAAGADLARELEVSKIDYDYYLLAAAMATSMDHAQLVDRLALLIRDPALRKRMGAAGRERARSLFDWSHVFHQYQALWDELNARRLAASTDPAEAAWLARAPWSGAGNLDPFHAFGHYPTDLITGQTVVALASDEADAVYRRRRAHVLFAGARLPEALALGILERLAAGPSTVADLAAVGGLSADAGVYIVGMLAKMNLVRLLAG